jgi:uncharacterized protein
LNFREPAVCAELAALLLPQAGTHCDGAHDRLHLQRVWRNAFRIQAEEGGDGRLLGAAVLLHDCVAVAKDSPQRAAASRLSAARARQVLTGLGWQVADVDAVAHAIEAHSYSAGIEPRSLEARILQDADRLDAIGLVGVARCFYTAGRMGSALYDPDDPRGEDRALDDRRFALDHFPAKLLRLAEGFRTATGRRLAAERHARLLQFLDGFLAEV